MDLKLHEIVVVHPITYWFIKYCTDNRFPKYWDSTIIHLITYCIALIVFLQLWRTPFLLCPSCYTKATLLFLQLINNSVTSSAVIYVPVLNCLSLQTWEIRVLLLFVIGVFPTFTGFMCNSESMRDELQINPLKVRKTLMTKSNRTLISHVCHCNFCCQILCTCYTWTHVNCHVF